MPAQRSACLAAALVLTSVSLSAALVTSALRSDAHAVTADAAQSVIVDTPATPAYALCIDGGEVCVYEKGQLRERTGVRADTLPAADRDLLRSGITADTQAQLAALLEDLTS